MDEIAKAATEIGETVTAVFNERIGGRSSKARRSRSGRDGDPGAPDAAPDNSVENDFTDDFSDDFTDNFSDDFTDDSGSRRRPVAPFIALGVAAVLAVLFVILAGARGQQNAESADTPLMFKAAPPIVGETLDGSTYDLSSRRGRWVVINFFQSTCVPCIQEHPELVAFAEQQAALGDGAELISAIFDDRPQRVQEFFDANGGGNWPVLLEEAGVPTDYGVSKVPETWIVDPTGRIVWRTISMVTADGLSAKLQQLRAERITVAG